jgi:hypothetical protein
MFTKRGRGGKLGVGIVVVGAGNDIEFPGFRGGAPLYCRLLLQGGIIDHPGPVGPEAEFRKEDIEVEGRNDQQGIKVPGIAAA